MKKQWYIDNGLLKYGETVILHLQPASTVITTSDIVDALNAYQETAVFEGTKFADKLDELIEDTN